MLTANTLNVYTYNVTSGADHVVNAILAPEDQQYCARLLFTDHVKACRQGRAGLRWVLSSYLCNQPQQITFEREVCASYPRQHGKPFILGRPIEFSYSSTRTVAAVAVSNKVVGCDVEHKLRMDHSQEVFAIAATAEERIEIELLPPERLSLETTRLWVRKEACLKAIGIGLLIEPATFSAWNIKQQWTTVILGSYVLAVNDFCCGEDTVVSIATTQSTPMFVRHYSLDWSAIAKDIGEIG